MQSIALVFVALLSSNSNVVAQNDTQNNRNADSQQERASDQVDKIPRIVFGQLDANDDGHLTTEEAQRNQPLVREFDRLDRDGDGKLRLEELREWDEIENVDVKVDAPRQ